MSTSQVEETLKRIQSKDGVVGVLIVNNAGSLVFHINHVNLQFYE